MTRLPALEAVAAAARSVRDQLLAMHGTEAARLCRELDRALARLDATPAAQSPSPTPTDEELFKIEESVRLEWQRDRIGNYNMRVIRALYNAGRAACVARLRERAALLRAEKPSRMDWEARAIELENAADALESER